MYDAVISYSSIEHSGLGRYGEPLDPTGDIDTMNIIKRKLKPKGICLLAVPRDSVDYIAWNAHRVYGPIRWPMLIHQFNNIKQYPTPGDQPLTVLVNNEQ